MAELDQILESLSPQHRAALDWFRARAGQEIPWPQPLPDGTHLVNKPKGIHKPSGWKHALSIRQSLRGPYADEEPVARADGTWTYRYFQEQQDPSVRDSQFTNRALLACHKDGVPVAVLRQTKPKPDVRYKVLGLAMVLGWDGGYFTLEGFSPRGLRHSATENGARSAARVVGQKSRLATLAGTDADNLPFNPAGQEDARDKVLREIRARRGQRKFRDALVAAYAGRCAVTGCSVLDVLEAAHITPYLGPATNHVTNGLLLRADLHTLFDMLLLAVDPDTMKTLVAPTIEDPAYRDLHGVPLRATLTKHTAPSPEALKQHRAECRW